MSKVIQIRDLDDETYLQLRKRAASEGVTLTEFLKKEIKRIANRPTMTEWLVGIQQKSTKLTDSEINKLFDTERGE